MTNTESPGRGHDNYGPHPALIEAGHLLRQRDELADLCGEMLATLRLPENQQHKIEELGDEVERWRRRFRENSGHPMKSSEET